MSFYTNYPHFITNQPSRIKDTKAQLHRVPELSVSEDVSVVWEPNPTVTDPLVAHSSSDTMLPEGLPLGKVGREKSEEMASFFTRVSFKVTDAEQPESRSATIAAARLRLRLKQYQQSLEFTTSMADWPNEGSDDDLLTWSPLHNDWLPASGSNESFPTEPEDDGSIQADHNITMLPEHHSNLDGLNYDNAGHLVWPIQNLPQADTPNHNLPPCHEAPIHLFEQGVSQSDGQFQMLPDLDPDLDTVDAKIHYGARNAGRDHSEYVRNATVQPSIPTIAPSPSPQLVQQVKAEAEVFMVRLIFETTFFPVDAVLNRMANDALSAAVARHHNAELNLWKERIEGFEELQRLKSTLTTILKDFEMVARFSVLLAYDLSLVISERGNALVARRIDTIRSLLLNDSFLDGVMDLRGSDGHFQPFVVPFAHSAIIRLVEIVLFELQYHRFILFDDSDKWKMCITNVLAAGGTLCRWLLKQYSTGLFIAAEFVAEENASYYDSLIYLIGRFDPDKRLFFEGLLMDIRDLLKPPVVPAP
ncbi:hypothetical protein C8R48DRAFT_767206 [Suillus tomentosus]|nr:hypothetical protein C8R48DRAFT_767206 [Suillus tomentosus]